jgi:hypothetical protein
MTKMIAKAILIVEMQVSDEDSAKEELTMGLDAFREAVQPSNEWGLTFWLATRKDLEEMAARGSLLPNPGIHLREEDD